MVERSGLSRVLVGGSHPVDLEDGRSLPVGEIAEIDGSTEYHRALIDSGQLTVINEPAPRAALTEESD